MTGEMGRFVTVIRQVLSTIAFFDKLTRMMMPKESGAINGGMMKRQAPGAGITVYINVESADEYTKKLEALGGTVVLPKTAVPSMGYFVVFQDTEGNALALWEENPGAA